jgi:hypothetical protein
MKLVAVKKLFVKGKASDFKGKTQNTFYIEHFNLTTAKGSLFAKKNIGLL